jgi:hypothetical protein
MVTSTDDDVLRQDMPSALTKVESAAKLLEEAAKMSQVFKGSTDLCHINLDDSNNISLRLS